MNHLRAENGYFVPVLRFPHEGSESELTLQMDRVRSVRAIVLKERATLWLRQAKTLLHLPQNLPLLFADRLPIEISFRVLLGGLGDLGAAVGVGD